MTDDRIETAADLVAWLEAMLPVGPSSETRVRPARLDPAGWRGLVTTLSLPMEPVDASATLVEHLGTFPVDVDWSAVEARLGTGLPADYRRLVDAGVAGRIRAVRLATPGGDPDIVDLASRVYERMRATIDERGGVRGPYHPEPGGLVPFAEHDNGSTLCWIPLDTDPDRWPVTEVNARFTEMTNHRMTATELLTAVWRTEPLDEHAAAAAAAAFLADYERSLPDRDNQIPVRTVPEYSVTDGRKFIVPWNSIAVLDHGDETGELAGNLPIVVDLDTGRCRLIEWDEVLDYQNRGFIL